MTDGSVGRKAKKKKKKKKIELKSESIASKLGPLFGYSSVFNKLRYNKLLKFYFLIQSTSNTFDFYSLILKISGEVSVTEVRDGIFTSKTFPNNQSESSG